MSFAVELAAVLVALYCGFLFWYGGRGKPLRALMLADDGREFVMQNMARYRAMAIYPPESPYDDDPRAADRRYGKAIVPHLLRYGNVPIFIARRCGSFIEPNDMVAWHYHWPADADQLRQPDMAQQRKSTR